MGFTSAFFQVLFAILLVIGFLVIGFAVYNYEMLASLRASQSVQITTPILSGIVDFYNPSAYVFNTLDSSNPLDTTYRNLGNSTNQPAGAAFAYNFWLYIDPKPTGKGSTKFFNVKPTKVNNVYVPDYGLDSDQFILLLRGTSQSVNYNSLCGKTKSDIIVKCPLIKLENNGDVLTVEFNTVQGPDSVMQNARNTCKDTSTDWNYMNSFKIGVKNLKTTYPAQWFMVTVVVMDTYPGDPLPVRDKARCQIYMNGAIQMDTYVDGSINTGIDSTKNSLSVLKQNQGNLYIAPQITFTNPQNTGKNDIVYTIASGQKMFNNPKSLCMADLTYMNYVPTMAQLTTLYNSGFTQSYAPQPTQAINGAPGQLKSQNAFMNNISTNTNPDAVSQIYTP